jgi:hypothetical protein
MLYGCGCGVVDNHNCLMISVEMRFFWLLLSTIKCSGVPSPTSVNEKSAPPLQDLFVLLVELLVTIAVGSASMICPLQVFSESDSESGSDSLSLISITNDFFERHSSMLCQGLLWKSHHFPVSIVFP